MESPLFTPYSFPPETDTYFSDPGNLLHPAPSKSSLQYM